MKLFVWTALLVLLLAVLAVPQTRTPSTTPAPHIAQLPAHPQQEEEIDPKLRELKRTRELAANKQRHEKIKRDTDRLLQLATELKLYVDKTNQDVLSLEVIKKTDEIEKLAKSIREKMKNGY